MINSRQSISISAIPADHHHHLPEGDKVWARTSIVLHLRSNRPPWVCPEQNSGQPWGFSGLSTNKWTAHQSCTSVRDAGCGQSWLCRRRLTQAIISRERSEKEVELEYDAFDGIFDHTSYCFSISKTTRAAVCDVERFGLVCPDSVTVMVLSLRILSKPLKALMKGPAGIGWGQTQSHPKDSVCRTSVLMHPLDYPKTIQTQKNSSLCFTFQV